MLWTSRAVREAPGQAHPGQASLYLDSSAPRHSAPLCSGETSSVFQFQPGKHSPQSSLERGSALLYPEGS